MGDLALSATHTRQLLTLDEAAERVHQTVKVLRRRIHAGQLPAARPPGSRAYYVTAEDVDRLYAPTLRTASTRPPRESPTARMDRQLAKAGFVDRTESR